MADSLLVADQSTGSALAVPFFSGTSEQQWRVSAFNEAGAQPLFRATHRSFNSRLTGEVRELSRRKFTARHVTGQAHHALGQIAANRRAKEADQQFRLEMEWIEKHRSQFANHWVALLGNKLLAMGNSAKEVFDATSGTGPVPLIVHLEGEILPFTGW